MHSNLANPRKHHVTPQQLKAVRGRDERESNRATSKQASDTTHTHSRTHTKLSIIARSPHKAAMFMKQATTDRLLGMLVTLATGAAIFYIQVSGSLMGLAGRREDDDGRARVLVGLKGTDIYIYMYIYICTLTLIHIHTHIHNSTA